MAKTTTATPAPRPAKIGDNNPPDYAKAVADRMAQEYAELANNVASALQNAQTLPKEVTDEEQSRQLSTAIVDLRDIAARAEKIRVVEKEPFLRGGSAVDQFFNGLKDRLDKGAKILTARVHNYNEARRIAEEKRRRAEFEAQQAERRRIEEEERRAAAAAAEAAAAAARARKPENIEAHQERAAELAAQADALSVDRMIAASREEEAMISTLQKPAEMVRERFDDGVLNTMKTEPYVELVDRNLLGLGVLTPYFRETDILYALKQYGKATQHKRPLAGAIIEMRAATVIRR